MDIRDVVSNFQLKGARIVKLNIENDFVNIPDVSETELTVNMGNNDFEIMKKDDILFSNLQLNISVIIKKPNVDKKICISMVLEGCFTFKPESESESEDTFGQMLLINGNSSLYSIARSYIMTVSSLSLDSGKIALPMINFVKLMQQKKDELN